MSFEILSARNLAMSESCGETRFSTVGDDDDGKVTLTLDKKVSPYIVLSCDERFLRTLPGILHFVLMVLSLISLICLSSSGTTETPFLTLPLSWHSRVFIFVTVTGFLLSLSVIILNITTVIEALPLNWHLFDLIVLAAMSFMYLLSSSLIASAISYYKQLDSDKHSWATEQLIAACAFGYISCVVYAVAAVVAFRNLRSIDGQFSAHHLPPAELTPQTSVDLAKNT